MVDVLHLILYATGVRLTRLGIRVLGFARTVQILGNLSSERRRRPSPTMPIHKIAAAVQEVSGPPYHASCLDRSVFLWFLMQRGGYDASLRIGVAYEANVLEGHAWVESEGSVVNDDSDVVDRFAVFDADPTGIVFS